MKLSAARLATAVVLGVTAITLLPSPAAAATSTFATESQWATGYVGRMTVGNDTAATITSWQVTFDLPAGTTITSHWNASLSRSGSRYVLSNLAWNGTLEAGASTSFGWVADGTGVPVDCTVNGAPCTGTTEVNTPPTAPTNLRLSGPSAGYFGVHWDASTDDVFVAGYEIYLNDVLVSTVSGTSGYAPYSGYGTYWFAVRAFDSAGAYSPLTRLGIAIDPPAPS